MAETFASVHNARFVALLCTRSFIREVLIVLEETPCSECIAEDRRVCRRDMPVLPHRHCLKPGGCQCWYAVPSG